MVLDEELFDYIPDDKGRERPVLKYAVPSYVLRGMGLLTGESGGSEAELMPLQIPVKAMQNIREGCIYTADFGNLEEHPDFPAPVQLVTLPCRSSTEDGECAKWGMGSVCPLVGMLSSVRTPDKERVDLIVVPLFPGNSLSPSQYEHLIEKRVHYLRSLHQWEETLAPVHFWMDAASRGMQFWFRSWFGG